MAENWLGDLILYYLVDTVGVSGVQVARFFLVLGVLLLLHSIVNFRPHPVVWLLLLGLVLGAHHATRLRNNFALVPLLPLVVWFWYQVRYRQREWFLVGFPLLLGFWANVHGTYLAGVGLLGLMIVGDGLSRVLDSNWDLWWWAKVSVSGIAVLGAVMFLRPEVDTRIVEALASVHEMGGSGLLTDPGEVKSPAPESSELYPQVKNFLQSTFRTLPEDNVLPAEEYKFPLEAYPHLYVVVSFLLIPIGLGVFIVSWPRLRLDLLLPFLAVCLVGVGYLRTMALIPLATVPIILVKGTLGDLPDLRDSRWIKGASLAVIVLFSLNVGYKVFQQDMQALVGHDQYQVGLGVHSKRSRTIPQMVLERYPDERALNTVSNGAYLIWKWWPEKKVLVDSKTSGYDRNFFERSRQVNYRQKVEEYGLEIGVVDVDNTSVQLWLLSSDRWQLEAFDQGMLLFERVENAQYVSPDQARLPLKDGLHPSTKQSLEELETRIRKVRPN